MIDIETRGSAADSVILAVGAVPFEIDGDLDTMHQFFKVFDMDQEGRTEDLDTIRWWKKQDPAVYNIMHSGECSLMIGLEELTMFLEKVEPKRFWCKGPSFDYAILSHAYRQLKKTAYWDVKGTYRYTNIRDTRTALECWNYKGKKRTATHDPVSDCMDQIEDLMEAFRKNMGGW